MRILYGVQGTGNGHISRSRKMAAHLSNRGADVTYLLSGRAREHLFDMDCFGDFQHRTGLTMVQRNGAVRVGATLAQTRALNFINDVKALDLDSYDLIISDFEPVSAWAARRARRTCIGIGHQYAFGNAIPRRGNTLASDLVMRYFAPVTIPIGLHWHHFDTPILPPIIDTDLRKREHTDHVLVYLPFEDQTAVTELLQRFAPTHFIQYASELSDGEAGNVSLRRACLDGFREDLCGANGVLCNAGFELVSECLHLGIPTLVKPVHGQMEQLSNALALQTLGWGSATNKLNAGVLGEWLAGDRTLRAIQYPDVAEALVDWLLEGDWGDTEALRAQLWSHTHSRTAFEPLRSL